MQSRKSLIEIMSFYTTLYQMEANLKRSVDESHGRIGKALVQEENEPRLDDFGQGKTEKGHIKVIGGVSC